MKVCLLNDSFPPVIDGVANVVMNYAKILQEEELSEVLVGTPRYPEADYSNYPYQIVPYQSFNTTKIVKGYRAGNPLDMEEISDMAAFQPDIIHTHCPVASTVVARMLRARTAAPIVFTYHTKFDVDIAKAVKAKFIQKETIRALVNNGVDFAKGRVSEAEVARVTGDYDLPIDIPVFLFVGRIIKYKGIPLILEALSKLADAGQDFRMIFVGNGPDEEELKEQARRLGLLDSDTDRKGRCIFVGPVYDRDTLRAWNTRADLFLFPSTYDTNGIVVREAAACGLASVLIKGSCAAEGITHDRNGYLIQENAEAFYTLLTEVCKDMEHLHQVGQCAMDEIYISWKESVYQAHKRYGEILELKNSGKLITRKPLLAGKFIELSMNLMEGTETMFHLPHKVLSEVHENMEEMAETFKISEIIEEIKNDIKKYR